MKQSELIELLKSRLEIADRTNANLLRQVADLTQEVRTLRQLLAERDDNMLAMQQSMTSLEDALLAKNSELAKEKRIKKGLSKLVENKSEKQTAQTQSTNGDSLPSGPVKPPFDPKTRGNNGAKRKEYFACVEEDRDIYPDDPEFNSELAKLIYTREAVRYEMVPMSFKKIHLHIHRYSQQGKIYEGKIPAAPLLNSNFDGSFIAGMLQLRFLYSMPVERIVNFFNDNGFDIGKSTAHGLIKKAAGMFDRLHEAMRYAVKTDPYLNCDETYHKVLVSEENTNGKKVKKGYMWGVIANTLRLAYYFYDQGSRKGEIIFNFIGGYQGTIQSDGLSAYRTIGSDKYPDIKRLPCLQHIKRGFLDIKGQPDADELLDLFNQLYHQENKHKIGIDGWTETDNLRWRRKYSPPILKKIKDKLREVSSRADLLPDSDLSRAVTYALNEMRDIPNIFTGGAYALDNNICERFNRYIALSRKNSMFFGSHAGAQRASVYYSLACSCRLNGINVFDYFTDILNRIPSIAPNAPLSVYRNLLPDKWAQTHLDL